MQPQGAEVITAVSPTTSTTASTSTAIPTTSTPIPVPTATATLIPTATIPPEATIHLLGPPEEALFRLTDTLSFYWQWPVPLAENQLFQVVLFTPNGQRILGQVLESNFGTQYNLHTVAHQTEGTESSAQWQVQLISTNGEILHRSASRNIRFLIP